MFLAGRSDFCFGVTGKYVSAAGESGFVIIPAVGDRARDCALDLGRDCDRLCVTVFFKGESFNGTCLVRGGDAAGVIELRTSGEAGTILIGEAIVRTPITVEGRGGSCLGGRISKRSSVALTDIVLYDFLKSGVST